MFYKVLFLLTLFSFVKEGKNFIKNNVIIVAKKMLMKQEQKSVHLLFQHYLKKNYLILLIK